MNTTLFTRLFASLAFVFIVSLAPVTVYAANTSFFGPIVPAECNCPGQNGQPGGAADYGCVLATIQNVINFAITIGCVAAGLALVYAGFVWMTSVGNPEKISQGRAMFINVMIGLVIVLSAWLIIDFIMKKLYNSGSSYGPWNSILADKTGSMCITAKPQQVIPGLLGSFSTGILGGNAGGGGGVIVSTTPGSTSLNVSAAAAYLVRNANSSATGACWTAVRSGLCAGGMSQFCSAGGYNAYQAGPHLTQAGFSTAFTGTYSYPSSERAFAYQAGDIVVFQPVTGHPNGHVAMYDGSRWISDYIQPTMSSNRADYQGGSFTIYRPH